MPSAKIYKMDGTEVGSVDLNDAVFGVDVNPTLVHEVVVALQAAKRQGNAETKTRGEVSGGGAKPYRQKGTGNARHGSRRETQMRGGGTGFGPHKRSYRQKVPASFARKALCGALSERVRSESLLVLEALDFAAPKTREFAQMLANLKLENSKTLVVTDDLNRNALMSARNLQRVAMRTASDVNALDVLNAAQVVVVREAISKLEGRLARPARVKESA